ncbi:DUF1654 domain-containing protein [Pseudomonas sp. L-22-4S-12]|uniref:DUF1654 domain-containing protein n=1 Tax=Pseudomonas sp. L-22-4S-12 TaxID=2610893 RepID=UPI00132B9DF7|nr:DUF1654 domain-containing protein [Pseudomonas sp. L-22-4S-12]MWV17535.1 DUF1654 domain-containing protein [Pseudomonas sp. L-22-4S-12]
MARKAAVPHQLTTFELLARRIQQAITSTRAQLERQVNIAKREDESENDWQSLLEQISEEESVTMTRRADGSVHLAWPGLRPH